MKQKLLNKLWLRVGMIVAIMTTALSGTVWADEAVAYTLTPASGSNNSYASNCDIEINSITWNLSGNSQVQPWRLGGAKSATFENTDRALYSKTAISDNITKIEITHGASAYITVNSMTVSVHSSAADAESGSNAVASFSPTYAANKTVTITKADATSWAGKFYRIVYNLTKTNSKNAGYVSISEAKFYKESGSSGPVQLGAPELTATANNGSVTLEWGAISNASSYTIQYADNASFTGATTVANATSPKEISGLTNGTTYYFKAMTVGDGTNYLSSDYGDAVSATPANVSKITITQDELTDFTNTYGWYDWTAGGVSGKAYAYKNSGMQFNPSKDGYWIYNTSPIPGTITSVKMVKASGTDRSWTLKAGTSEISTTDGGTQIETAQTVGTSGATWAVDGSYNYFLLYVSGGSTVIGSIEITYIPSTDPVIVASDPAALAYDATGGEFGYSITNPTSATLNATSNCDWITNVSVDGTNSKVTFSTSTNTAYDQRTGTITLSYTGADNKVITITQAAAPVIYTTIPALFAKATEVGNTETNVNVTFGNWVVSGVHNNNVFLTDNQGNGLIIYTSNHGFAVNDKLSGTVSETPLKLYNGFAEFTNLTASTSGLTVTKDGEITVITNKTIAELGGVNTGAVITLSNLTYDGTNLSDGTNTIKPYNSLYNEMSLTSGNTYNITGVYQQYSNTKEILPRSAADIEEYLAPKHTVTFFVNGVEQTDDEAEVSEGAAIIFPATPADVNGKTFMGWTTEEISGTTDTAPTIVTSATMGNADVTYYAVFATSTSGGASDTYSLVSDVNDLSDGDNIILVSTGSYTASGQTHYFTVANGNVNSSNLMDPVDVTITDDQVTSTDVAPITLKEVTGGWKLQMGTEYINIVSTKNQITLDENGAVNTISITSGDATIGTADGSDTRNIYYNPNSGNGRFAYYKSAQKPVSIYKQEGGVTYSGYCTTVAPATESVTVTDAGYATYCSENALDFTNTDIKAYVGTKNGDKLTFTPINQVPANTGLLLAYEGGKTEDVPVIASASAIAENCLVGVNVETNISSNDYILNKVNDGVGFYKAGDYTTLGAHKAYIPAAVGNGVKGFTIDFDDDATGISLMEDGRSQMEDGVIYNLAGQRISKMQKGINIVNGKKVLK